MAAKIVFTGHRDSVADEAELARLAVDHPGALWIHGGAKGFDAQVHAFAQACGLVPHVERPDNSKHFWRVAPLRRNDAMLDMLAPSDLVVACYDGRQKGGTAYTVREALRRGLRVEVVLSRRTDG